MENIGLIKNDFIKNTFGKFVRFLSNVALKRHCVKAFLPCKLEKIYFAKASGTILHSFVKFMLLSIYSN